MLVAAALELGLLIVVLASADWRTRIAGAVLWCAYLHYSASLCALRALAEWLHDQGNPPGGTGGRDLLSGVRRAARRLRAVRVRV